MTGDRVMAVAAELTMLPNDRIRIARRIIAALDECDRVAGVVRARLDVAAIAHVIENWNQPRHKWTVTTVGSDAYALAQDIVAAALAAAGAQPPPKEDDQR